MKIMKNKKDTINKLKKNLKTSNILYSSLDSSIDKYRERIQLQNAVCVELWFELMKHKLEPNEQTKEVLHSFISKDYFNSIKKGFKKGKITNVNTSHLPYGK